MKPSHALTAAAVGWWTEQVGFLPITPVSNAAVGVGAAVRAGRVRLPRGTVARISAASNVNTQSHLQ